MEIAITADKEKVEKMPAQSVLVIEDSPLNARLIQALLSPAGLLVTPAESAEKALETLEGLIPDLILMDMQLPGMSGLDLTRLLKADASRQKIPILALSANNSSMDRRAMMDAGCVHFISKPIDTADFAARIRSFIPGAEPLLPVSRADSEINQFDTLRKTFLSEGAQDSELVLEAVEQGANDLNSIDRILHRWIGCGYSAGFPEISDGAQKMRDLISCPRPDLAALTGEAQALRQIFGDALALCAS